MAYVNIDVDLSEFSDDELLEELENRNINPMGTGQGKELLEVIFLKRRLGQNYQTELDQYISDQLGRIL